MIFVLEILFAAAVGALIFFVLRDRERNVEYKRLAAERAEFQDGRMLGCCTEVVPEALDPMKR